MGWLSKTNVTNTHHPIPPDVQRSLPNCLDPSSILGYEMTMLSLKEPVIKRFYFFIHNFNLLFKYFKVSTKLSAKPAVLS